MLVHPPKSCVMPGRKARSAAPLAAAEKKGCDDPAMEAMSGVGREVRKWLSTSAVLTRSYSLSGTARKPCTANHSDSPLPSEKPASVFTSANLTPSDSAAGRSVLGHESSVKMSIDMTSRSCSSKEEGLATLASTEMSALPAGSVAGRSMSLRAPIWTLKPCAPLRRTDFAKVTPGGDCISRAEIASRKVEVTCLAVGEIASRVSSDEWV
mmetsp:Transcript_12187/g.40756  ORF Transcript_12187/g.40756 Transcript_12187/m.40756 type:complete len:210 (-) Transcript_12187:799-1428(-)